MSTTCCGRYQDDIIQRREALALSLYLPTLSASSLVPYLGMEATVDRKIFTVVDLVYVDVTSILASSLDIRSSTQARGHATCMTKLQTPKPSLEDGDSRAGALGLLVC